jgi:hypothetical protein
MASRKVLALTDFTARGEAVLRHASTTAARDGASLIAVHVIEDDPPFGSDGPGGGFLPEERQFFAASTAAEKLHLFLARNDAAWAESTVLCGRPDAALARLVAHWKPDLILTDEKAARNRAIVRGLAAARASVQVLTFEPAGRKWHAVALPGIPAVSAGLRQRFARTLLLGAASALLYWLMFANEGLVLEFSAKGRWYFLFPVAIAFLFSFVHGAFTAEFWDALGVRPRRRE